MRIELLVVGIITTLAGLFIDDKSVESERNLTDNSSDRSVGSVSNESNQSNRASVSGTPGPGDISSSGGTASSKAAKSSLNLDSSSE